MKLFTKGDRRYTEATASEILEAASDILSDLGIGKEASILLGMARFSKAHESNKIVRETKVLAEREKNPL